MNDHVTEAFTELAPQYEETVDRELRAFWGVGYRDFVDRLIESAGIQPSDVVLDVATGTAVIPLGLADKVDSGWIAGLDITPAMLSRAQRHVEATGSSSNIALVCASGMSMPFAAGVFDVVICGLGTHHMNVPQMLAEMKTALKRGGKLVLSDVGASPFWRSSLGAVVLRVLMFRYGLTLSPARAQAEMEALANLRTIGEWRSLLTDFGFTDVQITELRPRRPGLPSALTIQAVAGAV
jgi:ubiquinone/menaquinone biosynthesis C-methylase UbiE